MTQIVNPSSETSQFFYDAANRQTGQTNGDGSTVATTFDNANRPTEIKHQNSSGTTLADYQYSYDGVSNVSTWTDSDGTVVTLGYDASDQLTSEVRDNSHGTGYTFTYTYDHNSNRLTKVVGTGGSAVTTTNTYGTHDQLLTSGSKSYGYDSNGNCTSVTVGTSVTSISYDYENRVVGISYPGGASNSFSYNGDDLRMQKVDSAGTANYLCDGTTPASAVLTDSSAVYTPGLSERRGSTSKFYHGDNLGSTRGITNSSQTVTDTILYDAFGNTISRTGTTPTPFGFVGKGQYQTDNDSGLQLLGHRYYDAIVGRFISSDPAKAGDNWYAYCNNDPLRTIDPTGLIDWSKLYGGFFAGGIINLSTHTIRLVFDEGTTEEHKHFYYIDLPSGYASNTNVDIDYVRLSDGGWFHIMGGTVATATDNPNGSVKIDGSTRYPIYYGEPWPPWTYSYGTPGKPGTAWNPDPYPHPATGKNPIIRPYVRPKGGFHHVPK